MADDVATGHFSTQPFKPAFLSTPGRPPIPWDRWKVMFEDWLLAIGFPDTDAMGQRKAALLRASLGTEGFRLYVSLTSEPREPYNDAVTKMALHFGQTASAIFTRAQFTRRQQRPGESVTAYVAALRELASKCEFPATQFNERIRDQFVAWCCVDRIRERLLQEPVTKSLDDLLALAVTMERAMAEAPALGHPDRPVHRIGVQSSQGRVQPSLRSSACPNCGVTGHAARSPQCPANGRECRGCGRLGHYAAFCRSSPSSGQPSERRRSYSRSGRRRRFSRSRCREVQANHVDQSPPSLSDADAAEAVRSVFINTVQVCAAGSFKRIACRIADLDVQLILDLGAKVSILARDLYERSSLSYFKLQPADVKLRAYNGQPIECLGRLVLPVSVGKVSLHRFTFYVTAHGDSVMGVDLFDAVGGKVFFGGNQIITTDNVGVASVTSNLSPSVQSSSVSLADYPALTAGFGRLKGFVHRPKIDSSIKPVQQRFYHQPLSLRQPISDELRRMEADGVIERISSSPWISNIVVARKKCGGVRICTNLSAANRAVIPERFPLPTMEELTEKLAGCTVFSKIDLAWSYMQLELAKDCRFLTAFVTHDGVYQWCSLPFGLSSGPSAFQQVVRTILSDLDGRDLEGCSNILDDILIAGRDVHEHDRRLRAVLSRLVKYGATVRADKCELGKSAVDFNGHRLSAEGVRPLQSNVEALLRIPPPVNQRQLQRFVGAASYYSRFVDRFADLCKPFRPLLKANSVWTWSPECQRSFELLKARIAAPPTLAHFDTSAEETLVTCDASAVALGACLSQRVNGVERPVAFASRVLSPAERNYSASEREALACLWACERWHFYVYGRRITLVTDHQALRTLLTAGGTGHRPLRLHRWCDRLYQYTFDVQFRPGRDNPLADCLSRSFDEAEGVATPTDSPLVAATEEHLISTIFGTWDTAVVTPAAVAAATAADQQLLKVRDFVVAGWPSAKRAVPPELHAFWTVRDELSTAVDGQCIVRASRLVIPPSLRAAVLELAHEGHPGIVRMKQKCRESVWWPGIDRDVEDHVSDCVACVVSGKSVRAVPGHMQPAVLPSGPWRKLALDFAGEFVAAPAHQRYVIVAVDYYSKWPETAMCAAPTTAAVTAFLTGLFDRFGLVEEVVTDNGVQFTSAEFADFLKLHGIRHSRTALYAPQSNAEAERFNRVLKEGIRAAMVEGKSFSTGIRQTLAAYRHSTHATTGVSPASLMLAFSARTPLSLLKPTDRPQVQPSSSPVGQPDRLRAVAKRVRFKQDQSAAAYDQRHRAAETRIVPGDLVRIRLPTRQHKLAPAYSEPRLVEAVRGNCVVLSNGQRWNLRRCLRHQPSLRSSAAERPGDRALSIAEDSTSSTSNPSTAAPLPAEQHMPSSLRATVREPSSLEQDENDGETVFRFPFRRQSLNLSLAPAAAAPRGRRRSTRVRRPRDFSSFVLY